MLIDVSCNFPKGKRIFKTKRSMFFGKIALNTKVNLLVAESKRIAASFIFDLIFHVLCQFAEDHCRSWENYESNISEQIETANY